VEAIPCVIIAALAAIRTSKSYEFDEGSHHFATNPVIKFSQLRPSSTIDGGCGQDTVDYETLCPNATVSILSLPAPAASSSQERAPFCGMEVQTSKFMSDPPVEPPNFASIHRSPVILSCPDRAESLPVRPNAKKENNVEASYNPCRSAMLWDGERITPLKLYSTSQYFGLRASGAYSAP
jgi:hypothetical protein